LHVPICGTSSSLFFKTFQIVSLGVRFRG